MERVQESANIVRNIIKIGLILSLSFLAGQMIAGSFSIYLKIAILILPIIGILLFLNPIWGFMILLFIRPLVNPLMEYHLVPGINLLGFFSFLNVILIVSILIKERDVKLFPKNLKWFYIYFMVAIFSLFNSSDVFNSFVFLMKLLSLIALFLLGYYFPRSLDDVLKIIRVIILSAIVPIIYGLYQAATGQGIQSAKWGILSGASRINSTFELSNGFADFLGMIILISILLLFYSRKNKEKFFVTLIISGAFICLLFTYVRAIWISIFVALCSIGLFEKRYRRWLILLALPLLPLLWDLVYARFEDIINPSIVIPGATNSLEFRQEITKQLLTNVFPKHPFFGFGVGQSQHVIPLFTIFENPPHNDYMRVLIETGIFGLITYLIFVGKLFFYLFSLIRRKINVRANSIFLALLLFYLVASSAQNLFAFIASSGYIFLYMGMAQKINDIDRDNNYAYG